MSTLALQQQLLVQSLLTRPGSEERQGAERQLAAWLHSGFGRGLMAYRAHGHALAERCLTAAFPVVAQLVGEATLQSVARALWHAHPPEAGDMGQWGAALPGWLDQCDDLKSVPYLPDVARVEWALHGAARAADATPDLPSLGRLMDNGADALTLQFAPGTAVFDSPWPVAELINHHLSGQPPLDRLVTELHTPGLRHALVVREGWRSAVVSIGTAEAALTAVLLAGGSLGPALDAAAQCGDANFDFSTWLLHAVQHGRITGVSA